ncbi:uncharacterized protein L3040_007839 [Drepanopeziza brunnea f. sp. 'multigermtubi']|uniref:Celp0028 effector like protein n=1 Tax=Marssonina brunnea f. sp. multigermtubi (strain MB_m1) TaxID=1072389 RepID=K1WAA3_MARBU|nr:uncharacterized protein MBM_07837 [Drepanopeziza brunnea f. sp. 'multigermtubi' MB_m1]EKD14160.1 hypothetical protein MBM_07837 [Drepanopeziza brunnea f. sp. 'multigermtubi' MB_m1]KAJ5035368.1 hypothetical protein L3040_007839 [Drepanopeziza brunnea f. sp. 'multigermtubi']
MLTSSLLSILMVAGLVIASPVTHKVKRTLAHDEVIVYGQGKASVIKRAEFDDYLAQKDLLAAPDALPADILAKRYEGNTTESHQIPVSPGCTEHVVFTPGPVLRFIGPDVPMSSVLRAEYADAFLAVSEGYSIANTFGATGTLETSLLIKGLSIALTVSFTKTWTTSYSSEFRFIVPEGIYAGVVSNPVTTRYTGSVDVGCIGAQRRESWQADTYTDKGYGGLAWVEGIIGICTSTTYPVHKCIGEGTL